MGVLILFEGVNGSGKSAHLRKAAKYLRGKGYDVCGLCDPGVASWYHSYTLLRDLTRRTKWRSPEAGLMAFMTARVELTAVINSYLMDSKIVVLLDRYHWSTMVYQGLALYGDDLTLEQLDDLWRKVTYFPLVTPDLTLLFSCKAEAAYERARAAATPTGAQAADEFERKGLEAAEQYRGMYFGLANAWLAGRYPGLTKVLKIVDTDQPEAAAAETVNAAINLQIPV